MLFSKVLVANRGEVAVRVIRALHELDVEAVAVYSQADEGSMHIRMADRAICIGRPPGVEPGPPRTAVMAMARIIDGNESMASAVRMMTVSTAPPM